MLPAVRWFYALFRVSSLFLSALNFIRKPLVYITPTIIIPKENPSAMLATAPSANVSAIPMVSSTI